MTTALTIKDSAGTDRQLAVVDDGAGVYTSIHIEQAGQRSALLAALAPLATAANQTANTASIVTAIQTTSTTNQPVTITGTVPVSGTFFQAIQPVSATALPLPTGAATDASLVALKTALGSPLQNGGVVTIAGVATDAKSEAIRALLAGTIATSSTSLPLPAGAATSALQTTGNTALTAIQTAIMGTVKVDTVVPSTSTNKSGTITTGGTAQVLMAANGARRGFFLQNNSSANLYVNGLGAATSDGLCLTIPAGVLYETSIQHVGTGAISILGATTGQAFYAREF